MSVSVGPATLTSSPAASSGATTTSLQASVWASAPSAVPSVALSDSVVSREDAGAEPSVAPVASSSSSSSWTSSSVALWTLGLLFLVVFVFFVVYYAWYRQEAYKNPVVSKHDQTKKVQSAIYGIVVAIFSVLLFLVMAMLLSLLTIIGLRKVEQKNLFQPTKVDRYRQLNGKIYSLPSGGLVLNVTPGMPATARRLLFLHGNTGNLELYREAFDKISEYGYDVWAVEYRGYGASKFKRADEEPSGESVCQDVVEAWNLMGTPDGIVAGFSLGGAILAQVYERLLPMPAQIVFLNSFGNLKQLLEDKLGQEFGATAAPLMKTKWAIQAPTTYTGKVLVVFTADDLTVSAKHGERLCQVFSKADLTCRELQRGGHRFSIFTNIDHWISELLPPTISDI